jgi:hypothetical protein
MNTATVTKVLLVGTALLLTGSRASAQSGFASMHGYIGFEGVPWADVAKLKLTAKVELRPITFKSDPVVKAESDAQGSFDIKRFHMGEYEVRISCPGYQDFKSELLFPSDFRGNLGVRLKKEAKNDEGAAGEKDKKID